MSRSHELSSDIGGWTVRAARRRLKPFLIALGAIALLELVIHVIGNDGLYNTDFFDFSPLQKDVLQKHVIYDKYIRILPDVSTDAVQVGDSSGFYGVIPAEVSKEAPSVTYLNLNCCGDTGWAGFFHEAQLALRSHDKPKFLVLHVTPFWAPASPTFRGDNQLSVLIRDYLLKDDWWHKVRMPSEGYRLRVTNLVYHGEWLDDFAYENFDYPTIGYPTIRAWRKQFAQARGWSPIPPEVPTNESLLKVATPIACPLESAFSETKYLGLVHENSLYDYLRRFAELAHAHETRFVFITNPLPCIVQDDAISKDIARQIERFKAEYPDAIIPFPFLRQWPREAFRDRWHLNTEGATHHSRLIGEALRLAVKQSD